MELKTRESDSAIRQLPKLKSLLKRYRQLKSMQATLLNLSELASKITNMDAFYPALEQVIKSVLVTDSFYIALVNSQQQLSLAYNHNPNERKLLEQLDHQKWLKSLTGRVFQSQQIVQCNRNERTALAKSGEIIVYGTDCVDWLGIPLRRGKQVIGVLALQRYQEGLFFTEQDKQVAEFIAEYLVVAIDRVKSRELLEVSIQQRTEKLAAANAKLQQEIIERQKAEQAHKAMLAISEITTKIENDDDFYQAIHTEISQLFYADNLYIALLDDQQKVHFPYYVDEFYANPGSRDSSDGLTEYVIKEQQPILLIDNHLYWLNEHGKVDERIFTNKLNRARRSKAWLGAPLCIDNKVVGVLAVQHYHDKTAFQTDDLCLIKFVCQHLATAIERKQQQEAKKNQQAQLEQLVNERTAELQESNLNLRRQIEERQKIEQRLYHEAHHDVLTKLPNRALLSDRLAQALKHIKRHPNHRFAVLFIDLDRFKIINDTLGHQAGDQFLIEVSSRLGQSIRENDVLARLGGDEFVILLDALANLDDIEDIASRIISNIEKPFEYQDNYLHSSASIGIAIVNNQYQDANEILRDADAAMYQAKNLGRGRYMFFDVSMREQLMASLTLEQELRRAINCKQFELHYQQISNLQNEQIIGFEALLRWRHPERGLLTPSDFLYMAEETGMIMEIETWVLEHACKQIQLWQNSQQHCNAFVSVNLTGTQLTHKNQLNALINFLKQQPIELEKLILEFDEIAFAQQPELALQSLRQLKELGVKLALDDYGSGMSSFNFIHSYPFEFIKLDRSFIRAINNNDKNLSLIKVLHELGDKFGYRLVAEGIESKALLNKVQAAGCEFGQGYFINKPAYFDDDTDDDVASCA